MPTLAVYALKLTLAPAANAPPPVVSIGAFTNKPPSLGRVSEPRSPAVKDTAPPLVVMDALELTVR